MESLPKIKFIPNENGIITEEEVRQKLTEQFGQVKWRSESAIDFVAEWGNGTTEIERDAFHCDYAVSTISLPEGLTKIGSRAFSCTNLISITIPEGVIRIDNWTFENCRALISVSLPESLIEIGYVAFSNSGLKSIVIPAGVTKIESEAFMGCCLMSIEFKGNQPPEMKGNMVFRDDENEINVTIPKGANKKEWHTALKKAGLKNIKAGNISFSE